MIHRPCVQQMRRLANYIGLPHWLKEVSMLRLRANGAELYYEDRDRFADHGFRAWAALELLQVRRETTN
jgi:hypothetical protein